MRFEVLGPLRVWTEDHQPVTIPGVKVRALLVNLLLHEGRPVSVDRLVEDLWEARPPNDPTGALQAKVSRLRRALDVAEPGARALVVFEPAGYRLDVDPQAVDIGVFTALTARARGTEELGERLALFTEALELWRGPAVADFADAPFARADVGRLEELRLAAIEESAEARLMQGEHTQLAAELGDLVARHPLRERLRAVHMRALYLAGRQSEALASASDLRLRLHDELGVDPGPKLAGLHQAILRQDDSLQVGTEAVTGRARTNLPAAITELVGRESAVEEVTALLGANRLVTLVGSGGVGKTRLAVEIATRLTPRFADGAWLVELAALGRSEQSDGTAALAGAVMAALSIREDAAGGFVPAGRPVEVGARLTGALHARDILLVLDNCEHIVDDVARLVEQLLRTVPGLRVLATSQEPIGLLGEVVWKVPPLELPDLAAGLDTESLRRSSAVELFVIRAAAAAPGFTLTAANARAVAVLCKRLDGIPLALELAATRVRALGVHELVTRLDDRFRLLATGHRGAPPRQQTLRSMIDWSWGLLTGAERALLRRLAVFADSGTLAAAERVCAGAAVPREDVLDLLARLVDRSLVVVVDNPDGVRYRLLESVAAYCAERLRQADEDDRVHERYQLYYIDLVEQADGQLRGRDQRQWLERLDLESTNIRRAFDRAVHDGAADRALRLANGMAWYWFLRGRLQEAGRVLAGALSLGGSAPAADRARALTWNAGITLLAGEVADRAGHSLAALRAYDGVDDPHGLARARWFLGLALYVTGDLVTSEELVNQALDGFRSTGDRWGVAATLSERVKQALARGDLAALRHDGARSAELFAELGDRWGQLQTVYPLAALAEITGDYDRAARLHRDGLAIAEDLGLWTEASDRLSGLGRISLLTGALDRAEELHERALRLSTDQSFKPGEIYARIGLALGARRAGKLDLAEEQLRTVLEWNRQVDFEPGNTLILAELGFVAEQRGDAEAARELHLAGFTAAQHVGDPRALALALEGLAGAEALAGRYAPAATLLGAASAARESTGVPLPPAESGDVDRIDIAISAALTVEERAAALAHGHRLSPEEAMALVTDQPALPPAYRAIPSH
ncbi:BTAD domain-containing putative transcriptional regulator [Micromonospora sp. WMMC250]|uniref:BTAD domain-containing putative transcriptional regulator n=1 Tax=Micromonospora sp. WMMC250 TaxID=3014781 RepID=UPI0022B70713|nr:BTAD domain-containing putative transcriptional regulator [Micromonospora sp. WMMC250]MCZ7373491.1 BTAD domain-containing putative transcriptional regulator [Micromonospora sp. WMMC250]